VETQRRAPNGNVQLLEASSRKPRELRWRVDTLHERRTTSHLHGDEQYLVTRSSKPNVRLLVVDDHSVVRRGVIAWLHTLTGFEVVGEAGTAREAVDQAELLKPDVVLLDVGMPGEGGVSASSQIVRNCPKARVVAFSASADPVYVRGMLAAGASAYVLKTSELFTLLSAMRSVLAGSRFLDPGLSQVLIEEFYIFPEVGHRAQDVLTARETQVLQRIVCGYTGAEIAAELQIKVTSVNTYRTRLREKLGLKTRAEIVRYGTAAGLTARCPSVTQRPSIPVEPDRPFGEAAVCRKVLGSGLKALVRGMS
jgi:two-component system response regulator NreC